MSQKRPAKYRPQYCVGQVKDPDHPTAHNGTRACKRFRWADPETTKELWYCAAHKPREKQ